MKIVGSNKTNLGGFVVDSDSPNLAATDKTPPLVQDCVIWQSDIFEWLVQIIPVSAVRFEGYIDRRL